jgi:phage baseplate assembly protein W
MQPLYGCNLDELLFESLDTRMKTLMADKVESAILYNEARISLERVRAGRQSGACRDWC